MPYSVNSRPVTIALVQMTCTEEKQPNVEKALARIAEAAAKGANIVCLQELFAGHYFCQTEDHAKFAQAEPIPGPTSQALAAAAKKHGVAFSAQNIGGMFGLYFAEKCPGTYDEVLACDKEAFNRFFHAMLDAGHYFAPSAFEAGFVSAAHSDADIAATVAAADAYFATLK